jgi:hypothetical protein
MLSFLRIRRLPAAFPGILAALLLLVACGDSDRSPTSPGAATATISGTVIRGSSALNARFLATSTGLSGVTVRVAGTGRATSTDGSGNFTLTDVPVGDVELEFERADIHARARIMLAAGGSHAMTIAIVGDRGVVTPQGHAGEEIEGLVSAIDAGAGSLTVLDQRLGAVVVQTDSSTLVRNGDGSISLSDIQVGMRVHVKALQQEDGSYLATEVLLQSDKIGGNRQVSGSVVSVDAGAGTFVVQAGAGNVTVRTDASTTFRRRGSQASFADLAAGVSVDVNGILQADGVVLARKVTIE